MITDAMVEAAVEVYAAHDPQSTLLDGPAMSAALTAALAAAWRPIETAPHGRRVLLGRRGEMSAEGFWHDGSQNHFRQAGWYLGKDDILISKPHHPDCWMPLPEPPGVV